MTSFPVIAKENGAPLAIINHEPTPLDSLADYRFTGGIGEFLSKLNSLLSDG